MKSTIVVVFTMKRVGKSTTTEYMKRELIESSMTSQLTDMMIDNIIEMPIQIFPMTPVGDEGKKFGLIDSSK